MNYHRFPKAQPERPSKAFTLLEVLLAMAVAMMIVGIAVLSIGSVGQERELRAHASVLEATARGALQKSVRTGRTISLHFTANAYSLGDNSHPLGNAKLQILRAGESTWRPPTEGETWTFHPSGLCEPIGVRITDQVGIIELYFDPLTAATESTTFEIFAGT